MRDLKEWKEGVLEEVSAGILDAENRKVCISAIEEQLSRIHGAMLDLIRRTNGLFEEAGMRDIAPRWGRRSGPPITLMARLHKTAGCTVIRYSWRERDSRKASFVSSLLGADSGGKFWLIDPGEEYRERMVELDRERRILNHLSNTLGKELSSLKSFHEDESDLLKMISEK